MLLLPPLEPVTYGEPMAHSVEHPLTQHHTAGVVEFAESVVQPTSATPLSAAEFRIKPLVLPIDFVKIAEATSKLDSPSLERLAQHAPPRHCGAGRSTVLGLVRCQSRSTLGVTRREFFVEDGQGNRLWVPGSSSVVPHFAALLSSRLGATVKLNGRIVWDRWRWCLRGAIPVRSSDEGLSFPWYKLHASTRTRMSAAYNGRYAACQEMLEWRIQHDVRTSILDQFDAYLGMSFDALMTTCLPTQAARRAAFGTHVRSEIRDELESLLDAVHRPLPTGQAESVLQTLGHLVACSVYDSKVSEGLRDAKRRAAKTPDAPRLPAAISHDYAAAVDRLAALHLPFQPTPDQRRACTEILSEMDKGRALRHLILGDVGTGKSAVMIVVAAAALEADIPVLVMTPRRSLAEETLVKFRAAFPDRPISFKAGDVESISEGAKLWIGTQGAGHQAPFKFGLVLIDEQHLLSAGQREAFVAPAGHLIETTATPIPRSNDRAAYGIQTSSTLHSSHAARKIKTYVRIGAEYGRQIFRHVVATSQRGENTIVVYRGKDEESLRGDQRSIMTVDGSRDLWKRQFGSKAVFCHGSMDDSAQQAALDAFRKGQGMVLCATTVVEIGLDFPNVRLVVIVEAASFGRYSLHQLRGRAAREGGDGRCILYEPGEPKSDGARRLLDVQSTQDGFALSDLDKKERGSGDTSDRGETQSGRTRHKYFRGRDLDSLTVRHAISSLVTQYRGTKTYAIREDSSAL